MTTPTTSSPRARSHSTSRAGRQASTAASSTSRTASSSCSTTSSTVRARSSAESGCSRTSGVTTSIRARTSSTSAYVACERSSARLLRSRPFAVPATEFLRRRSVELLWGVFALANLGAMVEWQWWETIPFHFIWVSLTVVYGFRVWGSRATATTLAAVCITTGALIAADARVGTQEWGELFEVPLMSAMFLAMVWHARRRQDALGVAEEHGRRL